MTRVDFYLGSDGAPGGGDLLTCRLAEKAYRLGHAVYLQAASQSQAVVLDDLLWTFRAGSFVPHALLGAGGQEKAAVLIGWGDECAPDGDVLINLASAAPVFFDRYARVAEIVDASAAAQAAGRTRFRFYREHGCEPQVHRIDT